MESDFAANICAISGRRHKMMKIALTLAATIGFAGAAFADPLEGTWRTPTDDNGNSGLVVVAPCGAALCGTLSQSFDSSGAQMASPNIGRQIIFDTTPSGDGAYRGQVWSPDRDKTYNSRLQLAGDTLSVSGCVFGICRDGGTWIRN
jgi:uncharacterized protein (DUF2147 family)